jgi:hypothetical protein
MSEEPKTVPVTPGGAQEYKREAVLGMRKRRRAINLETILLGLVLLFLVAVIGLLVYDAILSVNTATNAMPVVVPTPK